MLFTCALSIAPPIVIKPRASPALANSDGICAGIKPDKTEPIVSWRIPPRPASSKPSAFLANFLGLVNSLGLISVISSDNFYQILLFFYFQ
ncbi:MAG: hypothetical protein [Asgard archaea virus SkuldV2]|nr:MAG: hypothetical protein [Asgard archaea virus SkuldV2]